MKKIFLALLILLGSIKSYSQNYADPYSSGIFGYTYDAPIGTVTVVEFSLGNGNSAVNPILANSVEWTINFPTPILDIQSFTLPAPFYEYARVTDGISTAIIIRPNATIPAYYTVFDVTQTQFVFQIPVKGTVANIARGITINNAVLPGYNGRVGNGNPNNDNAGSMIRFTPALPVKLSSFTAKKSDEIAVRLDWATTAETNSEKFEVQHSADGKVWDALTTIAAKGESDKHETYNYTHTTPGSGENLYRLKMIDLDGTFAYSRIKSVSFDTSFRATAYPNPTSDKIKIKLEGFGAGDISKVSVISLNGSTVYTSDKLEDGIDIKALSVGTYIVTITLKNGSKHNSKIVIVK